jgi:YihY family inner membrane protein
MNIVKTTINRLNKFQQSHPLPAFIYAVIKKYGEDQAGYQAALLTYYAFLSLFPLLLILTTLTSTIAAGNPHFQREIIRSTTNYFPVLGDQLSVHIHSLHKSGLALAVGILFTFYGSRGVADAFRNGVQNIWYVPRRRRDGFPKSTIKSLALISVGGAGFILASIAAGLTAGAGHGLILHLLAAVVNFAILFLLFSFLINVSLPRHVPLKDTRAAAITAALGLVILQSAGSYLLKHELKSLDALYSYFALSLGLLFWIYLQAQVLFYSVEIAAVHAHQLWPRSLDNKHPTSADTHRTEIMIKLANT